MIQSPLPSRNSLLQSHQTERIYRVLIAGCLLAVVGCTEPEGIHTYTVKRTEPQHKASRATRMLAAIVPRSEDAWFFKLTGPDEAVASQVEPFEQLIKSLQFSSSGEPQWKLPEKWVQKPGNAMRYATLEVDIDGTMLECTVSSLPSQPELDEYLLVNINRWRSQLQLPPLESAAMPQQTKTIELGDNKFRATVVNLLGESAGSGMGSAPFAGGGNRAPFAGGAKRQEAPTSSAKVSFKAPSNWTQGELEIARGPVKVRREAAFEVKDGDRRIEISITKLPSSPEAILPNVNRWRGEIGLGEFSAEEFAKEKKELDVAGTPAAYVQFSGKEQSILGVIAEQGGQFWFIKLKGHNDLAERERQNFEDFVRSVRWE